MLRILEIIGEDQVLFENTANDGENLGDLTFSDLLNVSGNTYSVTVNGLDVEGNEFEEQEIEIAIEGDLNPTKIFFAIAAVLKAIVCPHCI